MTTSPLTPYQIDEILSPAQRLRLVPPPPPWMGPVGAAIGGATMAGFCDAGHLVVLSHSGYGIIDPVTAKTVYRDSDEETANGALSLERLLFRVPHTGEFVAVFGVYGGDGVHVTSDGWETETIYPWWPLAHVLLTRPRMPGEIEYLAGAALVHRNTGGRIHSGFSPDGLHLVVLESDDITIFSRPQ